ncbi:MAG: hypothetical protein K0R54_790 [Clostridiaceae bacterium]|jgi:hypothetical protein|nr:hypothetical protein [Clostridiaceae bacterium]
MSNKQIKQTLNYAGEVLSGLSVKEISLKYGISDRTAYRHLNEKLFNVDKSLYHKVQERLSIIRSNNMTNHYWDNRIKKVI